MDWSSESAAERTAEPYASVQCPNERNPIFFTSDPGYGQSKNDHERANVIAEDHDVSRGARGVRRVLLFDNVSERLCVLANSNIPGHDDNQWRRLAKDFCCRQMHGIERSNRLHRERSADAGQDGVRHCDDEAPPLESTERPDGRSFLISREPRSHSRSKNRPRGFSDCQRRSDLASASANGFQRVRIPLQQRGDQSAGFNVTDPNRVVWRPDATACHDRRRSSRRRFQPAGECQATPL